MQKKKGLLFYFFSIIIFVAIIAGGVFCWRFWENKKNISAVVQEQAAAAAIPAPEKNVVTKEKIKEKILTTTTTPDSAPPFNLAIPFISQAPTLNWDKFHEDYCEEAALLMAAAFLQKQNLTVAEQEIALAKMRDWEIKTFGFFESTTVVETARVAREYLGLKTRVLENPNWEEIRTAVAAQKIVLLPTNGKLLKNPYFKNGGPLYHMLVVRGFTATGDVITNDPGTRHGANFVYKKDVLMNALHDWQGNAAISTPASGAPRAIVIE